MGLAFETSIILRPSQKAVRWAQDHPGHDQFLEVSTVCRATDGDISGVMQCDVHVPIR